MPVTAEPPSTPTFSVIVPTYRRAHQLCACLDAFTRLEVPPGGLEVLVVDDGSEVPPDDVVATFASRLPVRLISQPHGGPARARNTGASHARGTVLAFTDDDCQVSPQWLTTLGRHVRNSRCLVGGQTLNACPGNAYSTASQMLIDYLYDYYNTPPTRASFFTSNNMAISAVEFQALGGFDASFSLAAGEDREFCDRWRHRDWPMVYACEAVIYHAHPLTLRTFVRLHLTYGRGAFHFHRARARRRDAPIKIEPRAFYLNLIRYPFRRMPGTDATRIASLLALAQMANALGFFLERRRHVLGGHREEGRPRHRIR